MTCEHRALSVDTVAHKYFCLNCGAELDWKGVKRALVQRRTLPLLTVVPDPEERE